MLTASGRLEEAFEVASATNSMPEICGRICPQDRLCEGNCVIERSGHGTVTIDGIVALGPSLAAILTTLLDHGPSALVAVGALADDIT